MKSILGTNTIPNTYTIDPSRTSRIKRAAKSQGYVCCYVGRVGCFKVVMKFICASVLPYREPRLRFGVVSATAGKAPRANFWFLT